MKQCKPEPIMLLLFFPEFLKNVTYYSPKVSYNSKKIPDILSPVTVLIFKILAIVYS